MQSTSLTEPVNRPPGEAPEALRAWKRRWEAVNARQTEEQRQMPIELKFKQLAVLMHSARSLGWTTKSDSETAEVRRRWARLREVYRG